MLIWAIAIVGCDKGDDSEPIGEADADSDTDTDADTDANGWTSIEGVLTYELRGYGSDLPEDGRAVCDATIEFTGTPYVGPCPECDFLFEVTGTVVRDDGNGACPFLGPLSIHDNTVLYDDPILIGFASEMLYNGRAYVDALWVGADSLLEGGVYARPVTGLPGKSYGAATVTGNAFDWTFSQAKGDPNWEFPLYSYSRAQCRSSVYSEATASYAPGHTTYGTLPCDTTHADVFSFRGVEGGTAYITVDTSDEQPVGLEVLVYSPEQCVDWIARANFPCSNGELDCPSLSVGTAEGDYLVVVEQTYLWHAPGDCDYRLDIDTSWDPELWQLRDDVYDGRRPATLEISGTATLK